MSIDERLEALTMNLELLYHTVQENAREHAKRFEKLTSSLEALVRVVESRERRLTDIEDGTG